MHGETIPIGPDSPVYTVREPVGVTAHIVPWNAPLTMLCRSLSPALATGNTAVVKPAEQTPLTALRFADLDDVAAQVVTGFTANSGQYCDAGSRLLVERSVQDELVARIVARTSALTLGPGIDDPDLGPLVSAEHHRRVAGYIETGQREGGRIVDRPRTVPEAGYFLGPTTFVDVTPDMRNAREEIFGPVLAVLPFDDEDQAVELANATDYGLGTGIHTHDIDRALRVAGRVEAGYVMINEYFSGGTAVPFGGTKLSGNGRERGLIALESYVALKTVVARIGTQPPPTRRGAIR